MKHEHYSKALSDVVKLLEKLTSYHDGNILSKWNIKLDLSVIPTMVLLPMIGQTAFQVAAVGGICEHVHCE